jgi:hypothetical protein
MMNTPNTERKKEGGKTKRKKETDLNTCLRPTVLKNDLKAHFSRRIDSSMWMMDP